MVLAFLVMIFLCGFASSARATCLSDAATALAVGTWTNVSSCMNGLTGANFDSPSNGVLAYMDSMTYDPTGRAVYFTGRGHGDTPRTLKYDDATDTWSRLSQAAWQSGEGTLGHGYDHNTIDTVNRKLYYRRNDTRDVRRLDIASGIWDDLPDFDDPFAVVQTSGIAYNEARNSIVYAYGTGFEVLEWRLSTNQWHSLGTGFTMGEPDGPFVQYSKRARLLIFGGGSGDRHVYRQNEDGSITTLNLAPQGHSWNASYVGTDPATGYFLFMYRPGAGSVTAFYSFNAATDTYTAKTLPPFAGSIDDSTGIGQTPIDTYGVSLWCTHKQGTTPACYIYKLAASLGPLTVPTIADETAAYAAFGWPTHAGTLIPTTVTDPCGSGCTSISDPEVHGGTEGDDLWTYMAMVDRGGNAVYTKRRDAWLRYFKDDYVQCVGGADTWCSDRDTWLLDHIYGVGLLAKYYNDGDSVALTRATSLATDLQTFYAGKTCGVFSPSDFGLRAAGRQLRLATLIAEATELSSWITLRNKILSCLELDSGWNATQGMYFVGEYSTDDALGAGSYAAGWRGMGTFQVSILTEAMHHAFRITGNTWIRERIVAIARFVQANALNPASNWPGLSFFININTGVRQWPGSPQRGYMTSLTNTLVLGYKYSGDSTLMDSAKLVYGRGTKYDFDGTRLCVFQGTTCADEDHNDPVHHYADTNWASATAYDFLYWNRGELQYAYFIFENGGVPTVLFTEGASGIASRRRRTS